MNQKKRQKGKKKKSEGWRIEWCNLQHFVSALSVSGSAKSAIAVIFFVNELEWRI